MKSVNLKNKVQHVKNVFRKRRHTKVADRLLSFQKAYYDFLFASLQKPSLLSPKARDRE